MFVDPEIGGHGLRALLEGIWHYAGLMGGARESGRQSGAMFCALGEKTADHHGTYELTTGKPQARE